MTDNELNFPMLYQNLTPLSAEQHGSLGVAPARDFTFAAQTGYVPLTMDEFPAAQRSFPVVFTRETPATPVALFSPRKDQNSFVERDGSWRKGAYVPGYLRRHPFHLVRKSEGADERILCADLTSKVLIENVENDDQKLFVDGAGGPAAARALEFCKAYEIATERTRAALAELEDLGLLQDSAIEAEIGGRKLRIDGFRIIAETKLRDLGEETLAGLAKRGALAPIYAHLFSLSNFAGMDLA